MKRNFTLFLCAAAIAVNAQAGNDVDVVIQQLSSSLRSGETLPDNLKLEELKGSSKSVFYTEKLANDQLRVLQIDFAKSGSKWEQNEGYHVYVLTPDGDVVDNVYDSLGKQVGGTKTESSKNAAGLVTTKVASTWEKGSWKKSGSYSYQYDTKVDASTILGSENTGKKLLSVNEYDASDNLVSTAEYNYSYIDPAMEEAARELEAAKERLNRNLADAAEFAKSLSYPEISDKLLGILVQIEQASKNESITLSEINELLAEIEKAVEWAKAEVDAAIKADEEKAAQELADAREAAKVQIVMAAEFLETITHEEIAKDLKEAIAVAESILAKEDLTLAQVNELAANIAAAVEKAKAEEAAAIKADEEKAAKELADAKDMLRELAEVAMKECEAITHEEIAAELRQMIADILTKADGATTVDQVKELCDVLAKEIERAKAAEEEAVEADKNNPDNEKLLEEAKTALSDEIEEASKTVVTIVYDNSAAAGLQIAIEKAKAVLENPESSVSDIEKAIEDLKAAVTTALEKEMDSVNELVDALNALYEEIFRARKALNNITHEDIAAELQKAIDDARDIYESMSTRKADAEKAIEELLKAVEKAKQAEADAIEADKIAAEQAAKELAEAKDALNEQIELAEKVLSEIVLTDPVELKAALESAKAVVADEASTKDDVVAANEALAAAIEKAKADEETAINTPTAIEAITAKSKNVVILTLDGKRVSEVTPGQVYIINGKKVVIK